MTQAWIANHQSAVAGATLSASSVRPSTFFEKTGVERAGNGEISLSGAYTGASETTLDVEILDGGDARDATSPVFAGVGSGALAVTDVAPGSTPQHWQLTLSDLGSVSATAQLDLGLVQLRAKVAGEAGNALRLQVTPALLVAASERALLDDWPAGAARQTGAQWDFGGWPLNAAGEIEESTPRLRIGNDPEVYRPYKEYVDGDWRYGLSPTPARLLPAHAPVCALSGHYTVTVSDANSLETYPAVTLYDLLSALQGSALLDVVGVVAADRRPGGASRIDVPLRTQAWALPSRGAAAIAYVPTADARTEQVVFTCAGAPAGAERWAVRGTLSGALGDAVSGLPFAAGPIERAQIALRARAQQVTGEARGVYSPTSRTAAQGTPQLCFNPIRLGLAARAGLSVTFTYQKKPDAACACAGQSAGSISNFLLGLEGSTMGNLDPALKSRALALYDWRRLFFEGNFGLDTAGGRNGWNVLFRMKATPSGELGSTVSVGVTANPSTQYAWNPFPTNAGNNAFLNKADAETVAAQFIAATPNYTALTVPLPCSLVVALPAYIYVAGVQKSVATSGAAIPFDIHVEAAKAVVPTSSFDSVWVEDVAVALADALQLIYTDPTALAAWDGYFSDAKAQVAVLAAPGDTLISTAQISLLLARVQAQMDCVLILGGILPKADASGGGGSAVWRDNPKETYWWADLSGQYLPAFNNQVYYSATRDNGSLSGAAGTVVNRQEFAFGLVAPCAASLLEGDKFTFTIVSVTSSAAGYQAGEEIVVDVVGASPAALSGGALGGDTHTWSVKGSVAGALPPLLAPAGGAADYTADGVSLTLAEGGIPFSLGDTFSFALEKTNLFRWRTAGGVWSSPAPLPLPGDAADLFDGVSARFTMGANPSFVAGDRAAFVLYQPYSPEFVRRYSAGGWQWVGGEAEILLDFGALQTVAAVALADHDLPDGAGLQVALSDDAVLWQPVALDPSARVAVSFLPSVVAARYLRLTLAAALGGRLGWVWAGVPLSTQRQADSVRLRRTWAIERGTGFNPSAYCAGAGSGGEIAWSMMTHADMEAVLALADHCQRLTEPLIFVPSDRYPDEAALVRLNADAIDLDDWQQFQPNDRGERSIALNLPLSAVLA